MLFSIVIPTYNRTDSLSICCKAISGQISHEDRHAVIIVDDGSDLENARRNEETCRRFGFTYIFQKNRGMAIARNTGIYNSNSEWIVFLDDDVVISNQWYESIEMILSFLPESIVAIEGMVEGSGDGVWDREVQNLNGGAFLTCHLAIRKSVLNELSGFDETFEKLGPYCEDHELAARLLKKGKIEFRSDIKVTHLPRQVNLCKYILNAPKRIIGSLRANLYFYMKHQDQYHLFRHAKTFWGTYRSILFKNLYNNIKRRSFKQILNNPVQSLVLIAGSLVEQISAWVMVIAIFKDCRKLTFSLKEK